MGGGTCGLSFTSHTPSDIRDPEQRRHCFHAAAEEGWTAAERQVSRGGEGPGAWGWGGVTCLGVGRGQVHEGEQKGVRVQGGWYLVLLKSSSSLRAQFPCALEVPRWTVTHTHTHHLSFHMAPPLFPSET